MACEHILELKNSSCIHFEGREFSIDMYKCRICNKWRFYNRETYEVVSLNGALGKEIEPYEEI